MMSDASSSTVRGPRRRWPLLTPTPSEVAPGVDPAWSDAFILELRLADVPGRSIGEALAEVGSHCAESSESPRDSFGDPVEYARSLGLAAAPDDGMPSAGRVVPWAAQALGLLLVSVAAPSWVGGEQVAVTTGYTVAAALLVGALVVVQRWGGAVLGAVVRRPVVAWLAFMAHLSLIVAVIVLLDGVVARVPGGAALTLGGVALAAGTVWELLVLRRDVPVDDPVTAPLTPSRPTRGSAVLRYGSALLTPVAGLVMVGVGLLLRG